MSADTLTPIEILLVEDRDDDAAWATEALTKGGVRCRITRAEDGEQALTLLQKADASFALMLLDLSMPKKTGLEVLREIRGSANAALKKLPVVILTTSTEFSDVQTALNLEAANFMSKPVKVQDLVEAVKKIVPDPALSDKERQQLEALLREFSRF
jgi:CheY-like chemotaxis protein